MSKLNDIANQILQKALEANVTVEQVQHATLRQVLGWMDLPVWFGETQLQKAKAEIITALQWRDKIKIRDLIKGQIPISWLEAHYPKADWSFKDIEGKLCIEIWPFGKPVVIETED